MRRLKFKPNLGASRGAGGGSGACVGGGRVRGVVGRVQQGGRQSGDESTGGESTSEVETGEEQKAKWLPVSFEGSQSWELHVLGDVSYHCYVDTRSTWLPTWSYSQASLVPRPSIIANMVEGLVKRLRRMTSGGRLEMWHFR